MTVQQPLTAAQIRACLSGVAFTTVCLIFRDAVSQGALYRFAVAFPSSGHSEQSARTPTRPTAKSSTLENIAIPCSSQPPAPKAAIAVLEVVLTLIRRSITQHLSFFFSSPVCLSHE